MSSISILTCLQVICTCWLVLGLRVLESNLLMRNGSVMMVTAICLLHTLTCTHNTNKCSCTLYLPTYTRAHTPPTPAHTYIRTYLRTYLHTYTCTHTTHTCTPGHQERWWCSLQPVSIRHHHHQTREDTARHFDDQRVSPVQHCVCTRPCVQEDCT